MFQLQTYVCLNRSLLNCSGYSAEQLLRECSDDGLFIQWFEKHQSPSNRVALSVAILGEPTPLQIANQENATALGAKAPGDGMPDAQITWPDLVTLASLVLRNQLLEESFSAELDKSHRRMSYNFAYGLSHELNNPLASISTRAGVLLSSAETIEQAELLQAIIDNAMRGCEMLGDLMLIARPPKLELQSCSSEELLKQLIEKSNRLLQRKHVKLVRGLQEHAQLRIDKTAMLEAMWCVVRNSLEAMPEGGQLSVCCSANSKWRCQVTDNGTGLTKAALESAFDPYYSGREAGRGLGVGLSKARRIVELHDGEIWLENVSAGGCRCTLTLPINTSG